MSATDDEAEAFRAELVAIIPRLRAFARTLTGDAARADDLAQDTLMKAWASRASFTPGTSLPSWTYTIMRNAFLSDARRSWRQQQLDGVHVDNVVGPDDPRKSLELQEVQRALQKLSHEHREALVLIAAAGCSYEEAAEILGVSEGTVKSRVSRARDRLERLIDGTDAPRR